MLTDVPDEIPTQASDDNNAPTLQLPPLEASGRNHMAKLLLLSLTGSAPIDARPGRQLVVGLTRLTQKAIGEYRAASDAYAAWMRFTGNLGAWFGVLDHLENCVIATHVALQHAERLRRNPENAGVTSLALPRRNVQSRIRKLRDAIVHNPDHLVDTARNADPFISLNIDSMELSGVTVEYRELVSALEQLDAIVSAVLAAAAVSAPVKGIEALDGVASDPAVP